MNAISPKAIRRIWKMLIGETRLPCHGRSGDTRANPAAPSSGRGGRGLFLLGEHRLEVELAEQRLLGRRQLGLAVAFDVSRAHDGLGDVADRCARLARAVRVGKGL